MYGHNLMFWVGEKKYSTISYKNYFLMKFRESLLFKCIFSCLYVQYLACRFECNQLTSAFVYIEPMGKE